MIRRTLLALVLVGLGACSHAPAAPHRPAAASPSHISVGTVERWRLPLPSDRVGIPTVTNGVVYVTTAASVVAVRDDGAGLWSTPFTTRIYAPRVDGDLVVVAGETATIALQRDTGEVRWRYDANERMNRPAVWRDVVIVSSESGRVAGLDRATGALRWEAQLATQSGAEVAAHDGVAVVVGLAEWEAFDTAKGTKLWSGDLSTIGTSSPAAFPTDKGALAVVATENKLIAVGLHDGQLRWETPTGQSELAQVPSLDGEALLVPDHWGRLTAYRPSDGAALWKVRGPDGVSLWGEPVSLGHRRVLLSLAKDGPRVASPEGALALRPPSPGLGVARLDARAVVVSTWGKAQNYLVAYDLDVGVTAPTR